MTYASMNIRDILTEGAENPDLSFGDQFYQDSGGLNIGFGFNLTANPSIAIKYLEDCGLSQSFTPKQWSAVTRKIQAIDAIPAKNLTTEEVDSLNELLNGVTISLAQAQKLMDNYYAKIADPDLIKGLTQLGVASDIAAIEDNSPQVWAALEDLLYNAHNVIRDKEVAGLNSAIQAAAQSGNWGKVALLLVSYKSGVSNRRLQESQTMLGFNPFKAAPYSHSSVSITNLVGYEQGAATATVKPYQYAASQKLYAPYLLQNGYYVPQPSDGIGATAIAASVAAQVGTTNGITISGAEIERLNAALPGSSISTGGIIYVPTAAFSDQYGLNGPAFPGQTLVLDSAPANLQTAAVIYTVGSSLDGSDSGALIIIDKNDANNLRFDAGTWSYYSESSASGDVIVRVTLATPGLIPLATLTIDTFTNAETVTLLDGDPVYSTTLSGSIQIIDPPTTSEQLLLGYLSDLGDTITAAQLELSNFDYLNPTGAAYTVTGSVVNVNNTSADVYYYPTAPGAIIAGQPTATITVNGKPVVVPATNILNMSLTSNGDCSQDAISGIQVLSTLDGGFPGDVEVTAAEFDGFGTITGGGIIIAADSGTFNLSAANVDPKADYTQLIATDIGSTTLIGSGWSNQILTASPLGDDMLEAGNGTGDMLYAGQGVDTLIGGSGGDTFVAYNYGALAAGSVITGNATGNTLQADGDLSAITVSGIQTLAATGNVTLTASESAEFTSINLDNGTLYAATAGVYDLAGKDINGSVDMVALSDGGTTLTAGDGDGDYYQVLTASPTGNDTLKVGNGNGNRLIGGGGNCTLIAGNGEFDILTSNGLVDSLTAGDGEGDVLTGGSGQDTLAAGNGAGDTLTSNGTADMLTAGNGAGDVLTASLLGRDVLKVGSGTGDTLNAGEGVDTLLGGTGGDTFVAADGLAAGSEVAGQGSGNTLIANGAITGAVITGAQTLDTSSIALTAAQLSEFTSIVYDGQGSAGIIYAATGGTYDVGASDTGTFNLTALASNGTTLIGNGGANEILTASATGKDTLENAGVMVAGGGVDTFINGGEVQALNGLKAGSTLTHDAELETTGDITHDSINTVNVLSIVGGSVTLTGKELLGFSFIEGATGSGLNVTTAGKFNLTRNFAETGDALNITALATTGTKLEENGTASARVVGISLAASASGNDTLLSSNAKSVTLNASGTSGNDVLAISGGTGNVLNAASSTGTDTLSTTGDAGDIIYAGNGTDIINIDATPALSGGDGIAVYAGGGTDTITDNSSFASNPVYGGKVNTIYGGSGTAIIYTSTYGGDKIVGGTGADTVYVNGACTLTGGAGNDTVILNQTSAGLSLTGGTGSNTLIISNSALDTIAQASISNFQTLKVSSSLTVSQSQFDVLTTLINTASAAATLIVDGSSAATYSLNRLAVTGDFNLTDSISDTSAVTLIGNNQVGQILQAGGGNDTLDAGSGVADILVAGTGLDTLEGGSGGDTFYILGNYPGFVGSPAPGTVLSGASGVANALQCLYYTNLSSYSITNIQTLITSLAVTLTASELAQFVNLAFAAEPGSPTFATLFASGAGVYDLAKANVAGAFNLSAASDGANVTLIGNNQNGQTLTAGSGTDTLIAGSGGGDQLVAGTGTDILTGGSGTDSFILNSINTVATVNGGTGDTTTISGAADTAILKGSGNIIDVTGKTDTATDYGSGINTLSLTGTSDAAIINNTASDALTLGGTDNTIEVMNAVTGTGMAFIGGTSGILEFGAATTDQITFSTATGLLKLDLAASFTGSISGFASGDGIDLGNFLFSGKPDISGITGTGAEGTYTGVTVTDGTQHVVLALLNETANEYGLTSSAYSLTADTAASPGTLFQLATSHSAIESFIPNLRWRN